MIISKTPLRITLGGGGTDLPSYYKKFTGALLAATINKHVYISLAETFNKNFILKYSSLEEVKNLNKIKHPLFRETLKFSKIKTPLNIASHSDISAGTGLGSSGAFTVGLLKALFFFKKKKISNKQLAEIACKIEIEKLREPVGKQDQYTAAFGGFNQYLFYKNKVIVKKLNINSNTMKQLSKNLTIFFTGFSRSSYKILNVQNNQTKRLDRNIIKNLDEIKHLGQETKKALEKGKLNDFAKIMDYHWEIKKKRSTQISNNKINYIYNFAKELGAKGGKLIGAGGGGFLMFYTSNPKLLISEMNKKGYENLNFKFEDKGSQIIT